MTGMGLAESFRGVKIAPPLTMSSLDGTYTICSGNFPGGIFSGRGMLPRQSRNVVPSRASSTGIAAASHYAQILLSGPLLRRSRFTPRRTIQPSKWLTEDWYNSPTPRNWPSCSERYEPLHVNVPNHTVLSESLWTGRKTQYSLDFIHMCNSLGRL